MLQFHQNTVLLRDIHAAFFVPAKERLEICV